MKNEAQIHKTSRTYETNNFLCENPFKEKSHSGDEPTRWCTMLKALYLVRSITIGILLK